MKARGGVVPYIRIALEKGFSDMYGSWGGRRPPRGATEARTKGLSRDIGQFWPILTDSAWACENAARVVRGQVPTPGYLPP